MKKPMQKIRTCLQKTPNALLCALGAVVFLAGFYFLCYRTPLNEVWLPTTMNNDEALYNRQVVSVLTHGGPQGYFGYQESTADIGRYGTWGPLLIWAYALPGLLFGASVNVVLWCNLLLIAVGIAVFARCARLNYWQCIALCGALFSIMLPLRSCVSGASEAMHYMLALLIVGTAAALHRSGRTGWLIACAAACAVETIFRPYALLFWVFPLTAVWQNKRRRAACLGTAAGGFAVSLFAMAKLAAPYFSDGGMDFDGIRLLLQLHPVAAVRYECARGAALLHAAWRDDILPTLHGETTYIGGGCVTFLAVVLVAVVCLVWDKHKGRPLVLKGCALFCSAVIALVLLFMYNIDPRHMMLLAILLLLLAVILRRLGAVRLRQRILRLFANGQRQLHLLALPIDRQRQLVADGRALHGVDQISAAGDGRAVDGGDDVIDLQAGLLRWAVRHDLGDRRALRQTELLALAADVRHADTNIRFDNVAVFNDALHDAAHVIDRDGEADVIDRGGAARAGAGAVFRVRDADNLAVHVKQRAAGVAGVDGRVGLDQAHAQAVRERDLTVQRADHTGCQRKRQLAERVADGDDLIADMQIIRAAKHDGL